MFFFLELMVGPFKKDEKGHLLCMACGAIEATWGEAQKYCPRGGRDHREHYEACGTAPVVTPQTQCWHFKWIGIGAQKWV